MDLQDIDAFLAVAETGSFSRAAERLFLSQPAISKRVAALEARSGRRLFDRIGRQIRLTDAGRALLPHARRALDEIEDGRRALSRLADTVGGRLTVGTSHHIGLHRLPPVLRAFTLKYPEVDLDIQFMDSEDAGEAVLAGRLELGIVTLPTTPLPQLRQQAVWPDPLSVVCAPRHPLAALARPRLGDLALHAAVLPDERTYTHRIITAALREHGLTPRIRLATNYLETIKMLVGIGLGWSVLPRSMLDRSLRELRIGPLKTERQLGAVWHQRRTLSGAATALLQLLPGA
jgi:DNA-binding transcriptional LysR family regulator